ncbi:RNA polymerase, sigma subunit, RpsC/SigC [Stanieria cyanosphaera PCC 7437]|uniref:RNA polymerase sigma factor n=1 Tax=Stanieria cyanosphaera (strain ATCC 29371 / PCC 7437) TaxID=111780 RepID=K9XYG2_STAC7|nr:RNA polymerase sigma factor SigC [Stanieria cyanosphaera]AFZ37166.1 RNA polymerase, sigma subunit, RpsC/SigC [Stanieria cyanosphaera PCC 7437]
MLASSLYVETEEDYSISAYDLELEESNYSSGKLTDDLVELDLENIDLDNGVKRGNRTTTDLVRLYLQEIGRVPLLERDEEVSEAQKVQRHINIIEQRAKAAKKGDQILQEFVELIDAHDRLVSQLSHRPSLRRWAQTVGMEIPLLKERLSVGKHRWAEVVNCSVKELERIQRDGIRAKEHMIKANLRLVVSVAKKYQNRGLELLDLIQEGTLGLERAVEKFDPTKGYRFSTYAYWWIRQGITRAIATQSRTIRLPVHITEKLNKIKKAQRKISQEKGHTPRIEDLAQELDMTAGQIREVLLRVPRSVSLEIKVGKEKDTELGDLLETESASPEETLMRESLQKDLQYLLSELTSREREVIQMRFGFGGEKPFSLAEIGRCLELSRERVRQIEAKALQKLRQPRRRNMIRDYLESLS